MSVPMTIEGEQMLRGELARLKNVDRRELSLAIGAARKLGDLKENSDYHAAKNRQGLVEARIRYIESQLADSQIIDITKIRPAGRVVFGATVTLRDLERDQLVRYRVVGADEADINQGKISVNAPLARAIIGKSVDYEFKVEATESDKKYVIEKIEHL